MKSLSRQDRNGTRTSEELRRRYTFENIDYTKEEIEKLKKEIITDDHLSNSSTNPVQNKVITQALNNKINKETGKGLSTNDFTDELKEKVEIAEENVIESISVNGEEQEIIEKNVNLNIQAISLLDVYPIGSIYMSVNSTNPSTLFGGTWVAWGSGRVPVGVDTTQTEFATVEQTGGEKAHKLEVYEMPSHRHNIANANENGYDLAFTPVLLGDMNKGWEGAAFTSYEGGDQPHNNLQPYITCYMWKRTK